MALGDINTTKLNASGIMSTRDFTGLTVGSFEVKKFSYSDQWYSTINQGILLGYGLPSQDDALALVHGVMLQKGGGENQVNAAIQEMIANGRGIIDASEAILDTYTQPGSMWRWRSSNSWWNGISQGTWSTTGTTTGTYLKLDAGSRIGVTNIVFSAGDPDQASLPADAEVRVTVTPSTGGVKTTIRGTNTGAGDSVWTWIDSDGNNIIHAVADMELGGNWGWDSADSLTIELVDPTP